MTDEPRVPIGQPVEEPSPEGEHDFAGEHDDTAVGEDITSGRDDQREEGSPTGWSGLEP
jgi:hypothetical protein